MVNIVVIMYQSKHTCGKAFDVRYFIKYVLNPAIEKHIKLEHVRLKKLILSSTITILLLKFNDSNGNKVPISR